MEVSTFMGILPGLADEGGELDERGAKGASRHAAGGGPIMNVLAERSPGRTDMIGRTVKGIGWQDVNWVTPAQPVRPLRQFLVGGLPEPAHPSNPRPSSV